MGNVGGGGADLVVVRVTASSEEREFERAEMILGPTGALGRMGSEVFYEQKSPGRGSIDEMSLEPDRAISSIM